MFEEFYGNEHVVRTLKGMLACGRIPQTLLFAGPEGLGKATLARRFAQSLLRHPELMDRDDLSLPENASAIEARLKLSSEKRNEDPLVFATHPDFLTFPPDGPLRQLTIQQMRLLKERAQFLPNHGAYRVFLIDHLDRANDQAANSLLKIMEEPPEHLILIATAENAYDLLPTIRSRSVQLQLFPLNNDRMKAFAQSRGLEDADRRIGLAAGSPGLAISLDLETYAKRRQSMLLLLEVIAGTKPLTAWLSVSESITRTKGDTLEVYLKFLYDLLRDLMMAGFGRAGLRNQDLAQELAALASSYPAPRIARATRIIDDLALLARRNIQKAIAFDRLIAEMS